METYGLIGYPLTQSFSQKHFTKKFADENIDAQYLNFELDTIDKFPEILKQHKELSGLNVTIPYKEKIIPFLHKLSDEAKNIGAVNVIKLKGERDNLQLIGYNSDAHGFEYSLQPLLTPLHKKALVLGTGGASKAVVYVLKKLGISPVLVSRNPEPGQLSYNQIDKTVLEDYKLVVNCTPLGMFPNTDNAPGITYNGVGDEHLFYDLIYNPEETLFLKKAKAQGAAIKNGAEMLIKQAEKAWEIWQS